MKKSESNPWRRLLRASAVVISGLVGLALATPAQQVPAPDTITWGRPLEIAADMLQERYGKPVTYEDPSRLWRAEREVAGIFNGRQRPYSASPSARVARLVPLPRCSNRTPA